MSGEPLVFLYAGQGCQYVRMAAGLFAADAVFRETLFRADRQVKRHAGRDLIETLHGADDGWLGDLAVTHPAIFAVQWAATRALEARGIRPDAVLGASLGEYVALCAAGIYRFEDMLDLVCGQARMMLEADLAGGMMAVLADVALFRDEPALFAGCALASVNFPGHFVVSGGDEAIAACAARLAARQVTLHRLPVPVGFHSAGIDPLSDVFRQHASRLERGTARIPCYSAARPGDVAHGNTGPAHLWSVARGTVEFSKGFQAIGPIGGIIDLSPSGTLATFVKYGQKHIPADRVAALMTPGDTTPERVRWRLDAVAALAGTGSQERASVA